MSFVAYDVSIELNRALSKVVPAIAKHDANLAKQIRDAATSISLNINEGARQTGGNQRQRYESAHGSANEVKAGLDLAEAWGWIAEPRDARALIDRHLRLLWGLTHPKR